MDSALRRERGRRGGRLGWRRDDLPRLDVPPRRGGQLRPRGVEPRSRPSERRGQAPRAPLLRPLRMELRHARGARGHRAERPYALVSHGVERASVGRRGWNLHRAVAAAHAASHRHVRRGPPRARAVRRRLLRGLRGPGSVVRHGSLQHVGARLDRLERLGGRLSRGLGAALAWLVRHLVEARDHDEKARTRTFLAAFAFGGAFATTDELATLGMSVPRLASFGTLVGTSIVAAAVFRFRLLDRDLSVSNAIYAAALATTGLIAYVVVLRLLGGNVAAFGTATAIVTLVLVAAAREFATSRAEQRERVERLTVFGRMAAQMAHDIKNPLAALLGAARVLDDAAPGQSP